MATSIPTQYLNFVFILVSKYNKSVKALPQLQYEKVTPELCFEIDVVLGFTSLNQVLQLACAWFLDIFMQLCMCVYMSTLEAINN